MSVPFYGKEFTFTQPDGTRIKVRGWGDQHHAVFETLDGFTVVQNPNTGFYSYATLSEDGNDLEPTGAMADVADPTDLGLARGLRMSRASARRRAFRAVRLMGPKRRCEIRRERARARLRAARAMGGPLLAPPSEETRGKYVGLCLLIQFPDVDGVVPQEDVDAFCNEER